MIKQTRSEERIEVKRLRSFVKNVKLFSAVCALIIGKQP